MAVAVTTSGVHFNMASYDGPQLKIREKISGHRNGDWKFSLVFILVSIRVMLTRLGFFPTIEVLRVASQIGDGFRSQRFAVSCEVVLLVAFVSICFVA